MTFTIVVLLCSLVVSMVRNHFLADNNHTLRLELSDQRGINCQLNIQVTNQRRLLEAPVLPPVKERRKKCS
jgi:hypothetical protein